MAVTLNMQGSCQGVPTDAGFGEKKKKAANYLAALKHYPSP